MDNGSLVSIIIPVYKVEEYLERCILSVVNQTYKNLEIILVDDGSPDRCPEICDEWAKKDERIKVIHKANGGLSSARNAGMKVASGVYLGFVDSDDWVAPRFVEILYACAIEYQSDLVECEYSIIADEVDVVYSAEYLAETYDTCAAMELHLNDIKFKPVVWNKLYKRNIVNIEFEEGKFHEDIFWTYLILDRCSKLAHVNTQMYFYFQRYDSIMGEEYSVRRLDAIEAAERRCTFIQAKYPDLAVRAARKFVEICMYHCQHILLSNIAGKQDVFSGIWKSAKINGKSWIKDENISVKQFIWLSFYWNVPKWVCNLRNRLKIGL